MILNFPQFLKSLIWIIEPVVSRHKSSAVFLDRDGVIIVEKNFHCDPETIEFIPGSVRALQKLSSGHQLVVVSNQSGIARGYFTEDDVRKFQDALNQRLRQSGIAVSGWYFCPHGPADNCSCRKPNPGMILQAAGDLSIDLGASWMVGDKSSDIGAGRAAGLRTVLVGTGYAGKEPGASVVKPDYITASLLSAADIIVRGESGSGQ